MTDMTTDIHGRGGRTTVSTECLSCRIRKDEYILSLGSCFSTEIGIRLADDGYRTMNNPFGVLYNPFSIARAIDFLAESHIFTEADVIPRDTNPQRRRQRQDTDNTDGSTSRHRPIAPEGGGYVSFFHHGSFARRTPEEFLKNANESLKEASAWFGKASRIIVTFGTAWVYRHTGRNIIVSNCHKHPAQEFRREIMDIDSITASWVRTVNRFPEKHFIFTVSPIRHKKDGLHGNQISKAILLLAADRIVRQADNQNASYFPAYEIVLDELRDYSWFTDDLVHPSPAAIDIVWQRFRSTALSGTTLSLPVGHYSATRR